jgi:hypothetical protein
VKLIELVRRRGLRRGALAGSLEGKPVLAARLDVGQTESAPDALVEQRRRRLGGVNGHRRSELYGTAFARWLHRILLRGGDVRAAVGAPCALRPVTHAGVALLPSVHERAAEQASTEAVMRLQTAHTAARLEVGAHLHKFAAGGAPELAAGGAAVQADTRGGGRETWRRLHTRHDDGSDVMLQQSSCSVFKASAWRARHRT